MLEPGLIPVNSWADVPKNMSDEETAAFWSTHVLSAAFFANTPRVSLAVANPLPRYYSVSAAAKSLGISEAAVREKISGSIADKTLHNDYLIPESIVSQWRNEQNRKENLS